MAFAIYNNWFLVGYRNPGPLGQDFYIDGLSNNFLILPNNIVVLDYEDRAWTQAVIAPPHVNPLPAVQA